MSFSSCSDVLLTLRSSYTICFLFLLPYLCGPFQDKVSVGGKPAESWNVSDSFPRNRTLISKFSPLSQVFLFYATSTSWGPCHPLLNEECPQLDQDPSFFFLLILPSPFWGCPFFQCGKGLSFWRCPIFSYTQASFPLPPTFSPFFPLSQKLWVVLDNPPLNTRHFSLFLPDGLPTFLFPPNG